MSLHPVSILKGKRSHPGAEVLAAACAVARRGDFEVCDQVGSIDELVSRARELYLKTEPDAFRAYVRQIVTDQHIENAICMLAMVAFCLGMKAIVDGSPESVEEARGIAARATVEEIRSTAALWGASDAFDDTWKALEQYASAEKN